MYFVLIDADSSQPVYYCCKPQENVPNIVGNFVPDIIDALHFSRLEDAEYFHKLFLRHLPHIVAKEGHI